MQPGQQYQVYLVDAYSATPLFDGMPSVEEKFGLTVRRLREERGFTQEKLAYKIGISRNYVGNIERAETNVTLSVIQDIAKALRITMAELIAELEKQ